MTNPGQCAQLLTEKDILQDCLSSQKFAAANYNTFAGECANEQLRNAFLNILDDEHRIQADIFTDMNTNGWYPTQPADQQKVQQTKQKFSAAI
ncbi:MAG: spore coat protein [Oscillospiraceae bacterium]